MYTYIFIINEIKSEIAYTIPLLYLLHLQTMTQLLLYGGEGHIRARSYGAHNLFYYLTTQRPSRLMCLGKLFSLPLPS